MGRAVALPLTALAKGGRAGCTSHLLGSESISQCLLRATARTRQDLTPAALSGAATRQINCRGPTAFQDRQRRSTIRNPDRLQNSILRPKLRRSIFCGIRNVSAKTTKTRVDPRRIRKVRVANLRRSWFDVQRSSASLACPRPLPWRVSSLRQPGQSTDHVTSCPMQLARRALPDMQRSHPRQYQHRIRGQKV